MPQRVLRRKRRQPELTTRAALSSLQASLSGLGTSTSQTTAVVTFYSASLVMDVLSMTQVQLYGWDIGLASWRHAENDSWLDSQDTDGLVVEFTWNWEIDMTKPALVAFPANWQGLRTPAGDSLASVLWAPTGNQSILAATSWP